MLCRIADCIFEINARYSFLPRLCHDYVVDEGVPALSITISPEEICEEKSRMTEMFSDGYVESLCVYRRICNWLSTHGAFLMHAAVLVTDGEAYAFTAKSGTGKSTHLRLWMDMLKEKAFVLNGDKPIVRPKDGRIYMYGTPWCGKEGWNRNTSAPLRALCFLERDTTNRIHRITPAESIMRIFSQLLKPSTPEGIDSTLQMAEQMLQSVPIYVLGCNISQEAAEVSYAAMHGTNEKQPRKEES